MQLYDVKNKPFTLLKYPFNFIKNSLIDMTEVNGDLIVFSRTSRGLISRSEQRSSVSLEIEDPTIRNFSVAYRGDTLHIVIRDVRDKYYYIEKGANFSKTLLGISEDVGNIFLRLFDNELYLFYQVGNTIRCRKESDRFEEEFVIEAGSREEVMVAVHPAEEGKFLVYNIVKNTETLLEQQPSHEEGFNYTYVEIFIEPEDLLLEEEKKP